MSFRDDDGQLEVALGGGRSVRADEIVALTRYRPDLSLLDELAGEAGFHLVGAKATCARTFLLKNGYAQLEAILNGWGG